MARYTYIPNKFARDMFNIEAGAYDGVSVAAVLQNTLGEDNYDRFVISQLPFRKGQVSGEIVIGINPEEPDRNKIRQQSIGAIHKIG